MAVRAPVARHRRGRRAGDAQGQRPGDGALQSRRAWLPSTAAQRAAAAVAGAWFRGHRVRADAGGDPAARRRPDPAVRAGPLRNDGEAAAGYAAARNRSEEHTSELQSLMRISYAVS